MPIIICLILLTSLGCTLAGRTIYRKMRNNRAYQSLQTMEKLPLDISIDWVCLVSTYGDPYTEHAIYTQDNLIEKQAPAVEQLLHFVSNHMQNHFTIRGTMKSPAFPETTFQLTDISSNQLYHFFAKLYAQPDAIIAESVFHTTGTAYTASIATAPADLYLIPGLANPNTTRIPSYVVNQYLSSKGVKMPFDKETNCLVCYPRKPVRELLHHIRTQPSEAQIIHSIQSKIEKDMEDYKYPELKTLLQHIDNKLQQGDCIPGISSKTWNDSYLPDFQTLCQRNLSQEQQQTCKNILCKVLSCMYNPSKQLEQIDTSATISAMEKLIDMNVYEPPAS